MTIANSLFTGNSTLGGPMADSMNTYGQALGGAILAEGGMALGSSLAFPIASSRATKPLAVRGVTE